MSYFFKCRAGTAPGGHERADASSPCLIPYIIIDNVQNAVLGACNPSVSLPHIDQTHLASVQCRHFSAGTRPLRRRRLTMLNPRLQPGDRCAPKVVPCKGTTDD